MEMKANEGKEKEKTRLVKEKIMAYRKSAKWWKDLSWEDKWELVTQHNDHFKIKVDDEFIKNVWQIEVTEKSSQEEARADDGEKTDNRKYKINAGGNLVNIDFGENVGWGLTNKIVKALINGDIKIQVKTLDK